MNNVTMYYNVLQYDYFLIKLRIQTKMADLIIPRDVQNLITTKVDPRTLMLLSITDKYMRGQINRLPIYEEIVLVRGKMHPVNLAKHGCANLLKWMIDITGFKPSIDHLRCAIRNGKPEAVRLLIRPEKYNREQRFDLLKMAIKSQNLSIVQIAYKQLYPNGLGNSSTMRNTILQYATIDITRWIAANYPHDFMIETPMDISISMIRVENMVYLRENMQQFNVSISLEDILISACITGCMFSFKYVVDHNHKPELCHVYTCLDSMRDDLGAAHLRKL